MKKASNNPAIVPAQRVSEVKEYYFSRKLKEIAALNAEGADIICMQECNYNGMMTLEGVADWMKDYPFRSYRVSSENTNQGLALACISRYPILSVETIKFSGSGNGIAQYKIALDADTLTLFNCHLQSFGLDDGDKSLYENIINDPSARHIGISASVKGRYIRLDVLELVGDGDGFQSVDSDIEVL